MNLAERIVKELSGEIRRGSLRPGDKLPTEAQVVDRFGVSRTVVREALSRLQASGLVETRHGVGTFVAGRKHEAGLRAVAGEIGTVMEVVAMLELRIAIESEAAALAAQRRTKEQLRGMRAALDAYELNIEGGETVAPDFRFHSLIAQATGNDYFASLFASLGIAAIPRTRIKLPGASREERVHYLARVNREHEDIYGAIARGDSDAARAAMRTHLSNSRERLRVAGPRAR
jgi:DNA-binding FadR family transcriptional regulator